MLLQTLSLQIGYESLREECELYERSKLKLNKYNQDIPHRIKLNVGGVKVRLPGIFLNLDSTKQRNKLCRANQSLC